MAIEPLFTIDKTSVSIKPHALNLFNNDGYNHSHSDLKLIKADTDAQAISASSMNIKSG